MRYLLLLSFILFSFWATAQKKYELTLSGYFDYYSNSISNTTNDVFQPLTTVGAREARFRKNISYLGASLKHKYFRANIVSHSGRIVDATWDSQLPSIQEANIGLHLFPDLYIDIGYFATHIGMESFMPKNNLLSSTSIITYNEPFYQRGARIVYEGLKNFEFQLWLLDGYNLFRDNNESKSVGLLASYEKGDLTLSYSNIIGPEPVLNGQNSLRTYHNLYANYTFFRDIFELHVATDFATQASVGNFKSASMQAYIATLRINVTPRISVTGRYEYQNDTTGFIGGTYTSVSGIEGLRSTGINMDGYTIGCAYESGKGFYLRYEMRRLIDRDDGLVIFGNSNSRNEQLFTVGLEFDANFNW